MVDIDECRLAALESLVICTQANTQCMNTDGSFECVCVDGYELVGGECIRKGIDIFCNARSDYEICLLSRYCW